MKSLLISLILTCLIGHNNLSAGEMQTLLSGEVKHGGFGGPSLKTGNVSGDPGLWVGGRGGWIMFFENGHALSIGGGGYGLVTRHIAPEPDFRDMDPDLDYYATAGYGGFEMEFVYNAHKLLHFNASAMIGAGSVMLSDRNYTVFDTNPDLFFLISPSLLAELNVTHFFRVSGGLNYKLTQGIGNSGFQDSDFSGVNAILTFKFGYFQ